MREQSAGGFGAWAARAPQSIRELIFCGFFFCGFIGRKPPVSIPHLRDGEWLAGVLLFHTP
jgi:hypothetical protein